MARDFVKSLENCRIVAFDSYVKADGKLTYSLGILQGREYCGMMSCDESIGCGFDVKTMYDKLCRIMYRTVEFNDSKGGKKSWDVIVGVDFIKTQEK